MLKPWTCSSLAGHVGLGLLAVLLFLGCSSNPPQRLVTLTISADTAGWIVPCGCTANQSGGMLRRGSYVSELRSKGDVLLLDAGGAAGGDSAYHRIRLEAILAGETILNYAAHNVGASEAAIGTAEIHRLAGDKNIPWVSANLTDLDGKAIAATARVVERGGRRFGITGVLSVALTPKTLRAEEPVAAITRAIHETSGKVDHWIVLAYCPEPELKALARALPAAQVVVGGPTGQSLSPVFVNGLWFGAATNKGKFLVELSIPPGANRKDWEGRIVEMTADRPEDDGQKTILADYLKELERRDLPASESGLAPHLPSQVPASYRIAGSQACAKCHNEDCDVWKQSGHAHAWKTIEDKGFHVDASCQQCHTTGFGLPGGFESRTKSLSAVNVGCESCHGPATEHLQNPKVRPAFAARDQCVRCHDPENSPHFRYAEYWAKIRHGH